MPELPEVETIVSDLISSGVEGRTVVRVRGDWPPLTAPLSVRQISARLGGERIRSLRRRGKYILMEFDRQVLLLHLRMSGRINLAAKDDILSPYEHLVVELDDGRELRLHDTRKFGRVWLVADAETVVGKLGVEPLGPNFSLAWLRAGLQRRNRMIKPLLLDQEFIAGLGNIYVDESLWTAGIHPQRRSGSVSDCEARKLRYAIPKVLRMGLKNGGTSLGSGYGNYSSLSGRQGGNQNSLKVYGRTGLPCPQCGMRIERIIVAQRSTHLCPFCQPPTRL